MRLAHKYQCRSGYSSLCDRGNGKPKRQKCSYCGGPFIVFTGRWGVFEHDKTGRYRADEAISLHLSERKAWDACTPRQVVQFVSETA